MLSCTKTCKSLYGWFIFINSKFFNIIALIHLSANRILIYGIHMINYTLRVDYNFEHSSYATSILGVTLLAPTFQIFQNILTLYL